MYMYFVYDCVYICLFSTLVYAKFFLILMTSARAMVVAVAMAMAMAMVMAMVMEMKMLMMLLLMMMSVAIRERRKHIIPCFNPIIIKMNSFRSFSFNVGIRIIVKRNSYTEKKIFKSRMRKEVTFAGEILQFH